MSAEPSSLACADLVDVLAGAADLEAEMALGVDASAHMARCLRCQAELASYRRLRRSLVMVRDRPVAVDDMLAPDILFALDHDDARLGRRVPGYAAATLGGLAAAAGVIALATRQRRSTRLVG